jgi:uncharacterized membrane protein YkvA (DUF1232 family)
MNSEIHPEEEGQVVSFYQKPNELLQVLIKNPFFSGPDDEIGERTLSSWVLNESKYKKIKNTKKSDILILISRLSDDGLLLRKKYGARTLVKPTRKYYLLKAGKPIIDLRRDEKRPPLIHKPDPVVKPELKKVSIPIEKGTFISEPAFDISCFEALLKKIDQYHGRDKELIVIFPAFLHLACKILNDRYTDWHSKIMISSALGYFVLEDDITPDHLEFGYSDDLYLLTYVLREIKKHVSPRLLEDNWDYEEDILKLIENTFQNLSIVVDNDSCEILHKVGLLKFKELNLEEYSGSYHHRIAKLAREKRELLGITAYLSKKLFHTTTSPHDIETIKKQLEQYGDYDEVQRLIYLSTADHRIGNELKEENNSFEENLEEQSRRERLRILLED